MLNEYVMKEMLDFVIDYLIETKGFEETVKFLISGGFKKHELEKIGFNASELKKIIKK